MAEIDRVLHDIDLLCEARRDIDHGVGDDQRVLVARDIHHKTMADPPRRTNAGLARNHGAHQLVGMQAALHQRFGSTLPYQLDCFRSRIMAVR
jgi:hypothetical protein